jgi:large subunit ribosomal protein L18
MPSSQNRRVLRKRRAARVRRKLFGSSDRPRLSVYKSNKHIYAQLIDDFEGRTLAASSSLSPAFRERGGKVGGDREAARLVGEILGEAAKNSGVQKIALDRNGYQYHGRVAELADAVRKQGVEF